MLKRARSLVGLDVGSHAVKALELTRTGHGYQITACAQAPVYPEGSVREAIQEVLSRGRFRTRRVVSAVSGKSVIVRYLTLVEMEDEELQNAIRFEADKYIPFDVDEVVLDCQRLEVAEEVALGEEDREGRDMRVLLVACKRSLVEDHYRLLTGLGLQPEIVDVDAFALGNAYEFTSRLVGRLDEEDRVVALVDIGANKTNINILRGTVSYFTREIYLGGDDFTGAVAKRMGLEVHEAEALKQDPGEHAEEVKEAILPYVEDLGNEIRLSFDYYENQFDREVDEVWLSGGGARLLFLEEALERIFEKRTTLWNPLADLPAADRVDREALAAEGPQWAIAVGLAARLAA